MEKQLSIKQNMLWNSFGSLVYFGSQWLISISLVRLSHSFEAAGTYSLALAVFGIFSPLAQYRMKTYQVSDVKAEHSTGEYLGFRFATCGLALLACIVYSFLTCPTSSQLAIFLYGLYVCAGMVIDVFHGCDQCHRRMDYIGQSLALQGIASFGAFSLSFIASQSLELSLLSMTVCTLLIGAFLDYPRTKRFDSLIPRISINTALELLIRCLPAVIAGIATSGITAVPKQFLSFVFGASALGAYSSVSSPIAIIQMGASYIYSPLLGYFSQYYANRDRERFNSLFWKTTSAIALVGICCSIGVLILGEPVLVLLFGESIKPYVYLALPLVFLAVLTGYVWFLGELLTSLRHFKGVFTANVTGVLFSTLLALPLINLFGMNGATYASLLANIVNAAVMLITLQRKSHAWW